MRWENIKFEQIWNNFVSFKINDDYHDENEITEMMERLKIGIKNEVHLSLHYSLCMNKCGWNLDRLTKLERKESDFIQVKSVMTDRLTFAW